MRREKTPAYKIPAIINKPQLSVVDMSLASERERRLEARNIGGYCQSPGSQGGVAMDKNHRASMLFWSWANSTQQCAIISMEVPTLPALGGLSKKYRRWWWPVTTDF